MNAQQTYQDTPVTSSYYTFPVHRAFPPDDFVHRRGSDGTRQLAFSNVHDANNWLGAVKAHPCIDPATDPTIDMIDANRQVWVAAMVDAVHDLSHCKDGPKMKAHFLPSRKSTSFQNLEVEAACHMLLDVLIQHCQHGFRDMRKFNLLNQKSPVEDDKTVNCQGRANNVLVALRTWKSICKGMIEETDKKWQLVNAPLSTMNRKVLESMGNSKKKSNSSAGNTARKELQAIQQSSEAAAHSPSPQGAPADLSTAYSPTDSGIQLLPQHLPPQDNTISLKPQDLGFVSRNYTPDSVQHLGQPHTESFRPTSAHTFAGLEEALITRPMFFPEDPNASAAKFSYPVSDSDTMNATTQSGAIDTDDFQIDYHANTNHFDHAYCFGHNGLAAPFPPYPISDHANSPTLDVQARNDAQSISFSSGTDVAHYATHLPAPVIHGNYPHIGSKRAREEPVDATRQHQSRRVKLDGTGSYCYSDVVTGSSREDAYVQVVVGGASGVGHE
jgi:hypothetical protein